MQCAIDYATRKSSIARGRALKAKDKAYKQETRRLKESVKPRSKWLQEAQQAVNQYVRLRDRKEPCISCDKPSCWDGQWHCSHYYSCGHSSKLRFNLWNMNKSCSVCNTHLSGNIGEYTPRLIAKIGQARYDYLLERKSDIVRYDVEYLKRLKNVFKQKIKKLMLR
jgi:hypothetical protein